MFETYLQFVGIAITNAQIMEASRQEYERNRVIFFEYSTKYFTHIFRKSLPHVGAQQYKHRKKYTHVAFRCLYTTH